MSDTEELAQRLHCMAKLGPNSTEHDWMLCEEAAVRLRELEAECEYWKESASIRRYFAVVAERDDLQRRLDSAPRPRLFGGEYDYLDWYKTDGPGRDEK